MATLEERFQVMKEVGDGSFGSVAVARVRTAGSHIARRGTMVCDIRHRLGSAIKLTPSRSRLKR
jgi:hypothetical protein